MFLKVIILCSAAICFLYTTLYAIINVCFRIISRRWKACHEDVVSNTASGESFT